MQNSCVDIERLIPQRAPIRMVDELLEANDEEAVCQFKLRADGLFVLPDDTLAEVGIIEHIAQSASALAGYRAVRGGAENPPVGYIGEVKNFCLYRKAKVGEVLTTKVVMGPTVSGVTTLRGETRVGGELVAETGMKIFIKED